MAMVDGPVGAVQSGHGIGAVHQQLEQQQKVCTELHNRLSGLEERLRMVLRPSPQPTTSEDRPEAQKSAAMLSDIIASHSQSIGSAIQRIDRMMEELEL